MPSLLDIRRRIRSVKNTQQLTKAMKTVSAAKLRRAQERVVSARPYANQLRHVLGNLAGRIENISHPLLEVRPEKRILAARRDGRSRTVRRLQFQSHSSGAELSCVSIAKKTVQLFAAGRKGRDFFRRRNAQHRWRVRQFLLEAGCTVTRRTSRNKSSSCTPRRKSTRFTSSTTNSNPSFSSASSWKSCCRSGATDLQAYPGQDVDYIFEQPPQEIFNRLLPRYVEIQIYRALLESAASEHGARMAAMDTATRNAGEMIESLTLNMNRVRQAAITREIIEVVSGAGAL